jgi:peptidoglycan/xylan/chitin deacetylase (PgdA/CDA1 family)
MLLNITKQHNLNFDSNGNFLKKISYKGQKILDEAAAILEIDFADYLLKKQPYLTSSQISHLVSQGFGFGAHSIDHPDYSELTLDQQLQQTAWSIRKISEKFDLKYRLFSFPFTDDGISSVFFELLFNKENPLADLSFACAGLKSDRCTFNIQRIPFEYNNFTSKEILYGEYLYYIFKSAFNKNIIYRC